MTNRFFLEIIDRLRRCGPSHNHDRRCSAARHCEIRPNA